MPDLALILNRHLWLSSRKAAERHLLQAKQLFSSQDPADIQLALNLIDTALKLSPKWDKAIELKARALLYLRRFKDVATLLQDFIPSLKNQPLLLENSDDKEKTRLLEGHSVQIESEKVSLLHCFSLFPFKKKIWISFTRKGEKHQWRYVVLGQACCHLGMMEDAMVLLSNGKRAASAAIRQKSNKMREDGFISDNGIVADSDLVSYLLGNVKFLLRRRKTALAALEAGLYTEAARHFSKIIDGRRGTPQGFIAECYMHRATAYHAANRVVDAIADCNKTLALNPVCAEALSTRATLYETIGCFSDCLQDLEQLKALYETLLQNYGVNELSRFHSQNVFDNDIQGCIDFITSKIMTICSRYTVHDPIDYHRILGVQRGCSRAEVERAYLLLCLKHRPDKAAHFIDRCEFVDERDIDIVKDQARVVGLKLFRLLQRSYIAIITQITQEEMNRDFAHIELGLNTSESVDSWKDPRATLHRPSSGFPHDIGGNESKRLLSQGELCYPQGQIWLGLETLAT